MKVPRPQVEQAISVRDLSKSYRVWHHSRDMMTEVLSGKKLHRDFKALTDISFEVGRGSVVGLMGRNGAGKSTLLRIIAGTLDATSGSSKVNGRISAILELGSGFHPEYTGRENIFMGGMCLGMSRSEITARYDEIVAFTELEEFMEQPFRTYSSGMQARLTFAVATCINPDVLIVDEALGVGDARFQLKCFDRIRSFKEQGKSILLVSHSISQIVAICDHALLLERGHLIASGEPNAVANLYHELLFGHDEQSSSVSLDNVAPGSHVRDEAETLDPGGGVVAISDNTAEAQTSFVPQEREHRYGAHDVEIVRTWLLDEVGQPVRTVKSLRKYQFVCRIRSKAHFDDLGFGFHVRDIRGVEVFGWDLEGAALPPIPSIEAGEERNIGVWFRANLNAGHFFISATLANFGGFKQDVRFDCHDLIVDAVPELHHVSLVNLDVSPNTDAPATVGRPAIAKPDSMAWRMGLRLIGPYEQRPEGWTATPARPISNEASSPHSYFLVTNDVVSGPVAISGDGRIVVAPYNSKKEDVERATHHLVKGRILQIGGPFEHIGDKAWKKSLPDLSEFSDNETFPSRSPIFFLEDYRQTGQPHAPHKDISVMGGGRFSHWADSLIFSTISGQDPNQSQAYYAAFIVEPFA